MYTTKCDHHGCKRRFTKHNKHKAQSALAMHVGRVHNGRIKVPYEENGGHTGVLDAQPVVADKAVQRKYRKLTQEEVMMVTKFIRKNQDDFASKSACFAAALEAAGLSGLRKNSGSAVIRYFAKANQTGGKRKYTRCIKPVEAVTHKTINCCPNCGCNLKAMALGLVMAERILSGAVVTLDGEKVEYAG